MMSKITPLKGAFRGVVKYATQTHKQHEVILSNGVRNSNPSDTIKDFQMQASLNERIRKNCIHIIVSHSPDDSQKIAGKEEAIWKDYLQNLKARGIDFADTQYIIYRHNDKGHIHYHMVANMVNNEGHRFKDSHIGYKAKYASKELTKQYQLTPAVNKQLQQLVKEQSYNIGLAIKKAAIKTIGLTDERDKETQQIKRKLR